MIGFKKTQPFDSLSLLDTESDDAAGPRQLRLVLNVRDAEVIQEIGRFPEGGTRDDFALTALRLGVLALRQASGMIDSQAVREEGLRLIGSVRELLASHAKEFSGSVSSTLSQYFDPATGDLPQRLERLVKKDGDLESLLGRHLQGEASSLAQTLTKHLGEQSPLFRLLSPTQSDGLLAALSTAIQGSLEQQRDHILGQFSLDEKDSALSRLVAELTQANGQLKAELAGDLDKIRGEFSLDNEQGALSRLVGRVEKAQHLIVEQFSQDNADSALSRLAKLLEKTNSKVEGSLTLDDEKSPLSRLRRELLQVIESFSKANGEFQSEVRATLEGMKIRREEAARSTAHGRDFQSSVGAMIQQEAQRAGDVFQDTGNSTGKKLYCKKGDFVITLSAECAAAGARIAIEAKEDRSYDILKALAEIHECRENREAQVGVFIFSKATAPAGLEPLYRHGPDVAVVWDRDDPTSDVFLKAAYSVARALAVRQVVDRERAQTDFAAMDKALDRIARAVETLKDINKTAAGIEKSGADMAKAVERLQRDLEKQLEVLVENLAEIKNNQLGAN